MKRIVRQILFCALLGFLLMGCSDEVLDRSSGDGEGRLIFSGFTVESVVGDIQTKASLDADAIPEAGDFTLTIVKADNTSEVVKTLPAGATDCFLPQGRYKVRATYGDEAAMSDIPYFFGESKEVTITAGANQTVELEASLACAVLRPVIDPQLEAQYESYTLTVMESTAGKSAATGILQNGQDFFVRGGEGRTYTLHLDGTNKLGDPVSHSWNYDKLVVRIRYIINCNPDLPAFTMPDQPEGNVWSKFMYITPMTAENMTAKEEMTDKVLANIVYEASADGGTTWTPSEKTADERYVIKGLEPSTTYTIRSRFGGVLSSNTQTVTTESAQQVENGDMETYSETEVFGGAGAAWCTAINCVYFGKNWSSRNEKTVDGAQNANGTSNYGVYWRWCSGTVSTTDKNEGNRAIEISTLAFYNNEFSGTVGPSILNNKREHVYSKRVNVSGTAYAGYLFTGTFNKDADSYDLGISHTARPVSFSFDYKYVPIASDQCIAYAKLYDVDKNEIASTEIFNSSTQDAYVTKTLPFTYTDTQKKAVYIGFFFQSGTNTNIGDMKQVHGDANSTPWKRDRVVGSVLKIDNVTLNYDYE